MPTDILLAIEKTRLARKRESADLRAYLLLAPTIACLFSILLALESPAYAAALNMMGMN
jgi:hypothetical protein